MKVLFLKADARWKDYSEKTSWRLVWFRTLPINHGITRNYINTLIANSPLHILPLFIKIFNVLPLFYQNSYHSCFSKNQNSWVLHVFVALPSGKSLDIVVSGFPSPALVLSGSFSFLAHEARTSLLCGSLFGLLRRAGWKESFGVLRTILVTFLPHTSCQGRALKSQ